jgi:chemotaxis protein methyltransferase CheR
MQQGYSLSDREFTSLSEYIRAHFGIHITPAKKFLLEARLNKRLRHLGIGSFHDYCSYLFSPEGMNNEVGPMIDVVTTNKTDFFRERDHFDLLVNQVLPELLENRPSWESRPFLFWSAGCATGEEPYSLAMVLEQFRDHRPDFNFLILATDISSEVLERAKAGIFPTERIPDIPLALRKRFFRKSRDPRKNCVRIAPDLRKRVQFARLNLMEEFPIADQFDCIFCRNVLIYFAPAHQRALLEKFWRQLQGDGVLFMGHSETMTGMDLPFDTFAPSAFRKRERGNPHRAE